MKLYLQAVNISEYQWKISEYRLNTMKIYFSPAEINALKYLNFKFPSYV